MPKYYDSNGFFFILKNQKHYENTFNLSEESFSRINCKGYSLQEREILAKGRNWNRQRSIFLGTSTLST